MECHFHFTAELLFRWGVVEHHTISQGLNPYHIWLRQNTCGFQLLIIPLHKASWKLTEKFYWQHVRLIRLGLKQSAHTECRDLTSMIWMPMVKCLTHVRNLLPPRRTLLSCINNGWFNWEWQHFDLYYTGLKIFGLSAVIRINVQTYQGFLRSKFHQYYRYPMAFRGVTWRTIANFNSNLKCHRSCVVLDVTSKQLPW